MTATKLMLGIALALEACAPKPTAALATSMVPIMNQMCVGNVGYAVLGRIFFQPVEKQGKLYVNSWTSITAGAETALEPRAEDYQGLLPVNLNYDGKLTFTTPKGSLYIVSVDGMTIVGRANKEVDVRLPCHPTTTKAPIT